MATSCLPDYAPLLTAYHRAFERELRGMLGALPIGKGARVLDVACGDGSYSRWLGESVGPGGLVVGVDLSHEFLALARPSASTRSVAFARADLDRLPFADETFDLVWCAQSLYSLPDPVGALGTMRRVVRPGGLVAVLENDSLHHVVLPWPVEIELAVRRAEWVGFLEQSRRPAKYYVARQLGGLFRRAGFVGATQKTWATTRQAPLEPLERAFLIEYLADLRERAVPHLEPDLRAQFERLVDPSSGAYLLDDPDFTVTCLDHVAWGEKAGPANVR